MTKPKNMKHNYTSELELKILLIMVKNKQKSLKSQKHNNTIRKYLKWHKNITEKDYNVELKKKRSRVRNTLKTKLINLAVETQADKVSYERFGSVILLMIGKILTKSNFSSYTYRDEFYSDAVHKIVKYLHNFDHTKISVITNQPVNAFAYISQIIHNSIVYVINTKHKEQENHVKLKEIEEAKLEFMVDNPSTTMNMDFSNHDDFETVNLPVIETSLHEEILKHVKIISSSNQVHFVIPKSYVITFEDYNDIKRLLKANVSIVRES